MEKQETYVSPYDSQALVPESCEYQTINIHGIIQKAREFQGEKIYFCFTAYQKLKPLTLWITTNCGKFLKRWEYQTTLPAS